MKENGTQQHRTGCKLIKRQTYYYRAPVFPRSTNNFFSCSVSPNLLYTEQNKHNDQQLAQEKFLTDTASSMIQTK